MIAKSDAFNLLMSFFTFIQTQFNSNIQIVRSDNGKEFTSLTNFFVTKGIEFQRSCVYTPQ